MSVPGVESRPPANSDGLRHQHFADRWDWFAFGATTLLTFAVYFVTLAPEVTTGFSGIFATGALYAGVPHPPGYPIWTLYAHAFTLMPLSNIAWRVALSSAVAAAMACGLVAMMVSRAGSLLVRSACDKNPLPPKSERMLKGVSGCVAGMGLGFDHGLWNRAVVADPWPLSLALFALVLCLLMQWTRAIEQRRYLHGASFVYGLACCNSQALFVAALGLEILVVLADRRLLREVCLANGLLFGADIWAERHGYWSFFINEHSEGYALHLLFLLTGIGSIVTCLGSILRTRRLLSEWKAVSLAGALFLLGMSSYLYSPIASMTNPPVNWAYPRTADGFIHLVTRGQYERIQPTASLNRFAHQLGMYAGLAWSDFGGLYLLAAVVPFFFLRRTQPEARRGMLGLVAVYLCLVVILLIVLNPAGNRDSREICSVLFSASHLVLAVWAGYGMVILGSRFLTRTVPIHSASIDA